MNDGVKSFNCWTFHAYMYTYFHYKVLNWFIFVSKSWLLKHMLAQDPYLGHFKQGLLSSNKLPWKEQCVQNLFPYLRYGTGESSCYFLTNTGSQRCRRWRKLTDHSLQTWQIIVLSIAFGPGHTKTCLMPYANNKGADQPAHPHSLISTFVVRCLDSMICILAISKVSRF